MKNFDHLRKTYKILNNLNVSLKNKNLYKISLKYLTNINKQTENKCKINFLNF